jgi:hypothetical protein
MKTLYKPTEQKSPFNKWLILLFFLIFFIDSHAQNAEKEEYLIARTVERGGRASYVVYIDYSNATGRENFAPNEPLYDSTGKTIRFKTESAALNHLGEQGWILVSLAPINGQNTYGETKYIFRRKVSNSNPQLKSIVE